MTMGVRLVRSKEHRKGNTYAGSIEVIVPPAADMTNSLLMKRPVGWEYFTPFGASSSRKGGAMVRSGSLLGENTKAREIKGFSQSLRCCIPRFLDCQNKLGGHQYDYVGKTPPVLLSAGKRWRRRWRRTLYEVRHDAPLLRMAGARRDLPEKAGTTFYPSAVVSQNRSLITPPLLPAAYAGYEVLVHLYARSAYLKYNIVGCSRRYTREYDVSELSVNNSSSFSGIANVLDKTKTEWATLIQARACREQV